MEDLLMIAPTVTEALRQAVLRDYLSGLSIWKVRQRYHWLRQYQIRECLEGHVRPKNTQRTADPSPEEILVRSEEVRRSWSDEVASRRWVGRFAAKAESRGSCLSALFRDMGGEG